LEEWTGQKIHSFAFPGATERPALREKGRPLSDGERNELAFSSGFEEYWAGNGGERMALLVGIGSDK